MKYIHINISNIQKMDFVVSFFPTQPPNCIDICSYLTESSRFHEFKSPSYVKFTRDDRDVQL